MIWPRICADERESDQEDEGKTEKEFFRFA